MARISEQVEWLSLIDRSGPFVVPAVLEEVFPQGLEKVEASHRQRLRAAYDEWRDAVDEGDPEINELHAAWTRMVLQDALEYEDEVLILRERLGDGIIYRAPEHGVEVAPDFAVCGDDGKPRLLIAIYPPETDLERPLPGDHWPAPAAERMTLLCRANQVRIGLVTNGEQWMLVNAPIGSTSGYASWFARIWWQEPVTLRAFVSLLGVRRCFGPLKESLDQLLERSVAFQEEVTDTLGEQVRRAVEVLIQALGRADEDRNGELLKDVRPTELYEAGLTVMMRLVFTLCAEERGLLLLGDPVYDQHYAVSTLRVRLREDESQHGPEILERRYDAWSRMLSVFRAVYGGIEHEALRMPALGGSLFDPDRFPFLEGRAKGTCWREDPAVPLPIDNRTVLLLLTALQVLEQRGGAQLLSYRALDIEQIGHVYEGLLEYTVARVPEVTLGLIGSQKVRHPTIGLSELETLQAKGMKMAADQLADLTGRSLAAIQNALLRGGDHADLIKLMQACGGDAVLAHRLRPFAELVRTDSWGSLLVYRAGSFAVTRGAARRETGTHYTPRSLTESIVEKTLEPVVYIGPAEGKPREEWALRPPAELLDLKICDPAMGSGAFLVQACRYLAERLVEAWAREEDASRVVTVQGLVRDSLDDHEPMPKDLDDRLLIARRLVAERCLYGVDLNPLAVELAKLSIWLVTLAKGRPFGFLDHNLRCGDSLLGIHRLDQLTELDMNPESRARQPRLFGRSIEAAVDEAIKLRKRLREIPIRDIRDVEAMARLDAQSRQLLEAPGEIADALVCDTLRFGQKKLEMNSALGALAIDSDRYLKGDLEGRKAIWRRVDHALASEDSSDEYSRRPFHWPLEFPEVFVSADKTGFDGLVGNPPYINAVELYNDALAEPLKRFYGNHYATARGSYDIYVLFMERAVRLSSSTAAVGLLVPNKLLSAEYAETLRGFLIQHCRIHAIIDFSRAGAFAAGVYPIACVVARPPTEHPALIVLDGGHATSNVSQTALREVTKLLWGYVLTDYAELLSSALYSRIPLGQIADVVGAATVAEAYEIAGIVQSNGDRNVPDGDARFIVSGNIRPFRTTWDDSPVQYLKQRYTRPSVPLSGLPRARRNQAESPKIILSGMSRRPTAFFDESGEYCAGKSTVLILNPRGDVSLETITQVLNSRIAALIYRALYGGLALAGGYLRFGPPQLAGFPIPKALLTSKNNTVDDDRSASALYGVSDDEVVEAFRRTFGGVDDSTPDAIWDDEE